MTSISVEQDVKNKQFISHQIFRSSKTDHLLSDSSSPEERANYVRKRIRGSLILLCAFIVYAILLTILPQRNTSDTAPATESVGAVQTVQLHDAALSTSTTVTTASGVFHVQGAVSAKIGDLVTLKKVHGTKYNSGKFLYVASNIKPDCYRLL
jgi:hypothetical protein